MHFLGGGPGWTSLALLGQAPVSSPEPPMRLFTALVIYKEYPHVDIPECVDILLDIIADTVDGKVRPHRALFDCRAIGLYPTTYEPHSSPSPRA